MQSQPGLTLGGQVYHVAFEHQQRLQGFANRRFVIDDQNAGCRVRVETLALLCGTRMPASDMGGFPCHREFEMECGAASHLALYLDLARMLLDDAVAHCQSQSGAAAAGPR